MPKLETREYQTRILSKTISTLESLNSENVKNRECLSVMIESPTGSGKTIMGFQVLQEILNRSQSLLGKNASEVKIGWCAMRRELLHQGREANETMMHVPNVQYVSIFDTNPPDMDVIVYDECQHSVANSAVNIYNISRPKIVLGLSATPYRTDRVKLCFHRVIKDAGYRVLIAEGFLSQFKQYIIPDWNPETVVNTYLQEPERWGKSIAFFRTVEDCVTACNMVNEAGMRAAVVTGNSPREELLETFDRGGIDIIFNVYVLSEGFDCPQLRTVFCRPSSKSPTIQMCGRAFRKAEGKEYCNLVQSKDTKFPFTRMATAEEQFVWDEQGWRSIGTNNTVNKTLEIMRMKVAQAPEVKMPKAVSNSQKKNRVIGSLRPEDFS